MVECVARGGNEVAGVLAEMSSEVRGGERARGVNTDWKVV